MVQQCLWAHLDVPLPELPYRIEELQEQGKGSTTWAAHSHTPVNVLLWEDFGGKIAGEAHKAINQRPIGADLQATFMTARIFLMPITEEEHVTIDTNQLLRAVFNQLHTETSIEMTTKRTALQENWTGSNWGHSKVSIAAKSS